MPSLLESAQQLLSRLAQWLSWRAAQPTFHHDEESPFYELGAVVCLLTTTAAMDAVNEDYLAAGYCAKSATLIATFLSEHLEMVVSPEAQSQIDACVAKLVALAHELQPANTWEAAKHLIMTMATCVPIDDGARQQYRMGFVNNLRMVAELMMEAVS